MALSIDHSQATAASGTRYERSNETDSFFSCPSIGSSIGGNAFSLVLSEAYPV